MYKFLATILASAIIAACGGGGTSPATATPAAAPIVTQATTPAPAAVEIDRLHCIIRPNSAGQWYVQNDVDHSPYGCDLKIEQTAEYLRVFFTKTYTHAGTVQITSDDDFNVKIQGFAALGVNSTVIQVFANGQKINPADVYSYVPQGGGNFWINVTMMNK